MCRARVRTANECAERRAICPTIRIHLPLISALSSSLIYLTIRYINISFGAPSPQSPPTWEPKIVLILPRDFGAFVQLRAIENKNPKVIPNDCSGQALDPNGEFLFFNGPKHRLRDNIKFERDQKRKRKNRMEW